MDKILKIWDNMNNTQLKDLACEMYRKYFHHDLKSDVYFIANEPKSCGGFIPAMIAINPTNYKAFNNEEAEAIVKHELIHYYLFRESNNDKKCGHNKHFCDLALKIGATGKFASLAYNCTEEDQKKYHSIAKFSKSKDNDGLQKLANKLYKKYFHEALHCDVYFGSKAERILGMYSAPRIIINPNFIKNKGDSEKSALDSVKHELIHYYLFEKYNNIKKCNHTNEFNKLADKLGINHEYKTWSVKYYKYHKCISKVAKNNITSKRNSNSEIYFYYSCGIGLYTKPYIMYTGARIHDKKGHLRKVYYVSSCRYRDYDKYAHRLVATVKRDKKSHTHIKDLYDDLINCNY